MEIVRSGLGNRGNVSDAAVFGGIQVFADLDLLNRIKRRKEFSKCLRSGPVPPRTDGADSVNSDGKLRGQGATDDNAATISLHTRLRGERRESAGRSLGTRADGDGKIR